MPRKRKTSIKMEFISTSKLQNMGDPKERVNYLLDVIKRKSIIVLDERLDPLEEKLLIEATLTLVDEEFTGIEISSIGDHASDWKYKLIKMLGGKPPGLTVIGPADLVKRIKGDREHLDLLADFKR